MKIFRRCSFCRIFLTVHALLLLPKVCSATTQSVKVEQMTSYFERQGYVVLRNFFPASQLEVWQQTAQQFFGSVFEILHEKGHTAFPHHSRLVRNSDGTQTREYAMQGGRKHGFREIVMRSNGTYGWVVFDRILRDKQYRDYLSLLFRLLFRWLFLTQDDTRYPWTPWQHFRNTTKKNCPP